jgi:L-alanine-DL-glutamate epimerase-like enolase superfamily enzyme
MISVTHDVFPLAEAFTISRGSRTEARVLTVRVMRDGATGLGECVPYARYGETMDSVAAQIEGYPRGFRGRTCRTRCRRVPRETRSIARCGTGRRSATARRCIGWPACRRPSPVVTAYTLSLDTPDNMRAAAARHAHRPLLKIKLGTPDDMPRLEAVREGAPDAALIVDANEGWTAEVYSDLAPHLLRLGVKLVEQPLPAGADDAGRNRAAPAGLRRRKLP